MKMHIKPCMATKYFMVTVEHFNDCVQQAGWSSTQTFSSTQKKISLVLKQ